MSEPTTCPLFVDGKKICEATSASYTVDEPVEFHGTGQPGPTKVEKDPPEYLIEAEIPEDIEPGITHESRVEVAFPPSTHGDAGWHVIEVWQVHQIEFGGGELELAAWQGHIHTGVSYLGDDTDTMTDDDTRIETTPGISMLLDTDSNDSNDSGNPKGDPQARSASGLPQASESSIPQTSDQGSSDEDFQAERHDI